jgi:hypothetical protein
MVPITIALLSGIFSLFAIALMARDGIRNGLLVVTLTFVLFAYGPVVNIARGDTYYLGISVGHITQPIIGFALAVAGMLAAHLLVPMREKSIKINDGPIYPLLPIALIAASGYGAVILVTRVLPLIGGNKLAIISAAGGGHYPYLLLEILLVSSVFMCRTRGAKQAWILNLAVYITYNLATAERDFLFLIIAVLVHREFFLRKRRSLRFGILAVAVAVFGTMLATARQTTGSGSLLSSVLNQAPILFIDSQLSEHVARGMRHLDGQTYIDAVLRLFRATDAPTMPNWFVSWYAPTSNSGYGFSLTGEAFLNFGLAGIPVIFFLLALTQRSLMNASQSKDRAAFLSVVFMTIWIYALRGDLSQILSTLGYAVVYFVAITCVRARNDDRAAAPQQAATARRLLSPHSIRSPDMQSPPVEAG